jgi:SAM-dependent methyltransferase
MRRLPFGDRSFASVLSIQAIEHVPDPELVLKEIVRVLERPARAVLVTPNRLTFGLPEEIIDPYHYVEYDPAQFEALCGPFFDRVEILGLAGSARYDRLVAAERAELHRLLALDPLRLRRLIPRRQRQLLYDWRLSRDRASPRPGALDIGPEDFTLTHAPGEALDLVAVCDCD